MDVQTKQKWDEASRTFDLFTFADDRRLGPHKRRLFEKVQGATLFVAAGTGNDFKFFPPARHIVAIDISPKMLERAERKATAYPGTIELREMDVCELKFASSSFDTVATVCTFCSVPRPVVGLREGAMLRVEGASVELRGRAGARIFRRGREPVEVTPVAAIDTLVE